MLFRIKHLLTFTNITEFRALIMKNRGGKKKKTTKKNSENSTNQEILPARGASAMLLEGTKQHTWTWVQFLLTLSSIITAVLVSTEYSRGGHRWHTQYISYYSTSLHLPIFPLIFFIIFLIVSRPFTHPSATFPCDCLVRASWCRALLFQCPNLQDVWDFIPRFV